MVSSAVYHLSPAHGFLTPPTTSSPTLTRMILIESESRFQPLLPSPLSITNNPLYRPFKCCSRKTAYVNSSYSSPPPPRTRFSPSTRLYVSGLSFRTTKESLTNAFKDFGELVEVNLVMDRIANRPRGFAFLSYSSEEESKKAIEGMHGKFLDGRVIFVEIAKSKAEVRQEFKQNPR